MLQRMLEVDPSLAWADAQARLHDACVGALGAHQARATYADDEKFVAWISSAQEEPSTTTSSSSSKKSSSKAQTLSKSAAAVVGGSGGGAARSSDFEKIIADLRASRVQQDVLKLFRASPSGALQGLLHVFDQLTPEQSALVKQKLGLSA